MPHPRDRRHPRPAGRARFHRSAGGVFVPATPWRANLVVRQWASIVGKLLTTGDRAYRVAAMYLEFENQADPDVAVTAPAYDRDRSVAYYDDLAGSADRDYLRVPLTAAVLDASDEALFPAGNRMTFFAMSRGTVGTHGKPFGDAHNSKVFGAALVAAPVAGDATRDLVFSAIYFDPDDQAPKLSTGAVGVEWEVTLQ